MMAQQAAAANLSTNSPQKPMMKPINASQEIVNTRTVTSSMQNPNDSIGESRQQNVALKSMAPDSIASIKSKASDLVGPKSNQIVSHQSAVDPEEEKIQKLRQLKQLQE